MGAIERSFGSRGGSAWPESASNINESAVNRKANPNIGGGISPARSLIVPAPPTSRKRLGDHFGARGGAQTGSRPETDPGCRLIIWIGLGVKVTALFFWPSAI